MFQDITVEFEIKVSLMSDVRELQKITKHKKELIKFKKKDNLKFILWELCFYPLEDSL